MSTTNSLGFGSLASVAWTDMNGTDLTTAQLEAVNTAISAASTIATVLIDVIKGAVKSGLTRFNLADLAGEYFQLTALNAPTTDTSVDWANFISDTTGQGISATTDLSLNEWRRVAAELQDHASQQASRRSPNGDGGGIIINNGGDHHNDATPHVSV